MRKVLGFLVAVLACFVLVAVVSAEETTEATVPTTCAAGCEDPVWEPLPSGNTWRTLDAGHYHYYLTGNSTTYRYTPNPNGEVTSTNSGKAVTICLDLNGYNINTDGRSIGVYRNCVLNIMDSSEAQTGFIKGRAGSNNLVGGTFFNYGTINLYNGTLKYEDDGAGTNPTYAGGVMAIYENATFNMYGGRLEGGAMRKVSGKNCHGGTIYSNGTINIYAGEVISGSVQEGYYGPCIYNYGSGKVTLSGSANVDNIYAASSTSKVNVSGTFSGKARITLGYTPSNGKAIGTATNTPSITGDLFCTNGNGWLVNVSGSDLALATFTPSGARHYCEHCKDVVKWTALSSNSAAAPKSTAGKYHLYLSGESSVYLQLAKGADVCLDLYGNTMERTGRALLANGGSTLNLMDSVGGGVVHSYSGSDNERGATVCVSGTATMNMYGGTVKFTDKAGGKAKRGMVAIGGVLNMYGGKIEGGALTQLSGSQGGAIFLYLSNSVYGTLNAYGGEITSGTVNNLGPCVYSSDENCSVKLAGDAKVANIYFPSNLNKLTVEGNYTGTASVTYPSKTTLALGTQVGVSQNAVVTGKITCTNNDLLVTPQDGKLVLSVNASAVIVTESGRTEHDTLQAAVNAYEGGYIQLIRSVTENVTISKDVHLELDGKTVTGTITVAEGSTLYVKDAQTDDYTVADGIYGQLTVTGNVAAESGYLMVSEDGKLSFHKVTVAINTMTLRPDEAGIYYKSSFLGDEKVAAAVESFGVALSVIDVPYEKNINTKCVSSEFTAFQSGAAGNAGSSTLLKGILKETNEEKINSRNLAMQIYGRPYIKTAQGYIFGEAVSRNLQEQLEAADALTEGLTASQWYGLEALFETYKEVLANVNTPNILEGFKDDTLSILMVGNSFCYYYVEELYGLLMANPDPGRGYEKVEIWNLYYSGCNLTQHNTWWESGTAMYELYKTDVNGRKKQTNSAGSQTWTLEETLQQGRWDYISLQGTKKSGSYVNDDPDVLKLETAALAEPLLDRFHELHPDAQLLWHRTWPFEIGRISSGYVYTEESLAQYNEGMQYICDYMTNEFDLNKPYDLIQVNSGAAWPVARQENAKLATSLIPEGGLCARKGVRNESTFPYLQGNANAGDGYHDGDIGGGQFLNACVWYESITGQSCLDNTYKPTTANGKYELVDAFAQLLRNAAHSVVKAGE